MTFSLCFHTHTLLLILHCLSAAAHFAEVAPELLGGMVLQGVGWELSKGCSLLKVSTNLNAALGGAVLQAVVYVSNRESAASQH